MPKFAVRVGSLPAGRRHPSDLRLRGGFSFTEIMFAVIILGIGFIMVAAMFPVALQQAKTTTEELAAAHIARGASPLMVALSDGATPLTTSNCRPLVNAAGVPIVRPLGFVPPSAGVASLWQQVRGNLVLSEDPRYGWVVLYRRGGDPANPATWDPYVQIYVIGVEARATQQFDARLDTWIGAAPPPFAANLMPRPVPVAIANDVPLAGGIDLIAIETDLTAPVDPNVNLILDPNAAATGAYVIISDDHITDPSGAGTDNRGRMNGRMFRLGQRRADLDSSVASLFPTITTPVIYELAPGSDFNPDPGADGSIGNNADNIIVIGMDGSVMDNSNDVKADVASAYIVGRGYSADEIDAIRTNAFPVNLAAPQYDGPSMAIGAYTTFVKVN